MNKKSQTHFGAFYDKGSKVLILGSFPSKISLKAGFFYQNRSNRFWSILGTLFETPKLADKSNDEKKAFLKAHKIALYDIWAECFYKKSNSNADTNIDEARSKRADLSELLRTAKIQRIFTTIGGSQMSKAPRGGRFKKWGVEKWLWDEYREFFPHCKAPSELVVPLYSTSNRSPKTNKELLEDYRQIKEILAKG